MLRIAQAVPAQCQSHQCRGRQMFRSRGGRGDSLRALPRSRARSQMGFVPENQVRRRLAAGGRWIRTSSTAARGPGFSARARNRLADGGSWIRTSGSAREGFVIYAEIRARAFRRRQPFCERGRGVESATPRGIPLCAVSSGVIDNGRQPCCSAEAGGALSPQPAPQSGLTR
jgi:hypothetical protein